MKLLDLSRKKVLCNYLESFNQLKDSYFATGQLADHFLHSDLENLAIADLNNWQIRLLVLPKDKFEKIIYFSILLLLTQDPSLMISGKKLAILAKQFGRYQMDQAQKLSAHSKLFEHSLLDFNVLVAPEFMKYSFSLIVQSVYSGFELHIQQRAALRCEITINPPESITHFWNTFTSIQIEQAVLAASKNICAATFRLDLNS